MNVNCNTDIGEAERRYFNMTHVYDCGSFEAVGVDIFASEVGITRAMEETHAKTEYTRFTTGSKWKLLLRKYGSARTKL